MNVGFKGFKRQGTFFFLVICFTQIRWMYSLNEENFPEEWHQFKNEHDKTYKDQDEEKKRFQAFLKHQKIVDEHNHSFENGEVSFKMKINEFGDMLPEDDSDVFNMTEPMKDSVLLKISTSRVTPNSFDWRDKYAVTPVKDQLHCGSCWAFAAVATIESHYIINTQRTVILSEQNLIDCSSMFGNNGCEGGLMSYAYKYVMLNGIELEKYYPYRSREELCQYRQQYVAAILVDYSHIPFANEEIMKQIIFAEGPIAAAMQARRSHFRFYSSGVYFDPLCTWNKPNHGVTVVGYGTENEKDYWIVKNSYGPKWGENGYFRIARNKDNHCGIASNSIIPIGVRRPFGLVSGSSIETGSASMAIIYTALFSLYNKS